MKTLFTIVISVLIGVLAGGYTEEAVCSNGLQMQAHYLRPQCPRCWVEPPMADSLCERCREEVIAEIWQDAAPEPVAPAALVGEED